MESENPKKCWNAKLTTTNGLKKDFTKNIKVRHSIKTLSWIAKNAKHVYVDRNWQRNFVWNTLKQMLFTTNVFNGHSTSTNILLANVEDCLRYCKKNNETIDTVSNIIAKVYSE